eukprot:CAMPEP_0202900964 /NCGR_PEP_ID=MMETSP1392-20130828/12404_1 /ASSEMBLY_ACC=CAM_ASM_000868 /TAXON_ID=225041 /ORGANISM="Chlamydomonas chlamydogama, Strain SAG 11-48b" /LENGTH=92 /DNA_ID=CAMNT_0049587433 /DNA_START=14 /DNA_END=288 /DNA_ORIENTATION=-
MSCHQGVTACCYERSFGACGCMGLVSWVVVVARLADAVPYLHSGAGVVQEHVVHVHVVHGAHMCLHVYAGYGMQVVCHLGEAQFCGWQVGSL